MWTSFQRLQPFRRARSVYTRLYTDTSSASSSWSLPSPLAGFTDHFILLHHGSPLITVQPSESLLVLSRDQCTSLFERFSSSCGEHRTLPPLCLNLSSVTENAARYLQDIESPLSLLDTAGQTPCIRSGSSRLFALSLTSHARAASSASSTFSSSDAPFASEASSEQRIRTEREQLRTVRQDLLEGLALPSSLCSSASSCSPSSSTKFTSARALIAGARLCAIGNAALSHACSLIHFHQHHVHCSYCGSATRIHPLFSAKRQCLNQQCARELYPRTEPVAITLVHSSAVAQQHSSQTQTQTDVSKIHYCLLGRQKAWLPGAYSCLAGFVEPGETMEQAAAREVYEESGIRLTPGSVRYLASEAWPFPSSFMMGCFAEASMEQSIRIDDELEDVQWFTREQVAQALEHSVDVRRPSGPTDPSTEEVLSSDRPLRYLPPPGAIAHRLIRHWVESTT
mmetsp:Transcript_16686/g.49912  ORF Transcript_16686/g.49912 Transcript_16686/m.49912 type:complete len:454 (+) Transcript_16686:59-1420(+)